MKFSEYVLESELNEDLDVVKSAVRDAAIKVGRKLGIKKAKDAKTDKEARADFRMKYASLRQQKKAEKAEKAEIEKKKKLVGEYAKRIEADSKEVEKIVEDSITSRDVSVHFIGVGHLAERHAKAILGLGYDSDKTFNIDVYGSHDGGKSERLTQNDIANIKDALYKKVFPKIKDKWYINRIWDHEGHVFASAAWVGHR